MAALAAMQYDWRLAAMHMLCSLGTLALRAVLVPINTGNFLFGTSAVALALSSLHQTLIGSRLLWTHGTSLNSLRRANTNERRRSASQHPAEDIATTELELNEGVPIVSPAARVRVRSDSEDSPMDVAEGVPVGRARYTMTCGVCVNCFKFISTLLNHSPNVKSHAYYKRGDSRTRVATGESHIESCGASL